jgi:hypothetical protein
MDPELEAFIALFPSADLTDPATARHHLTALADRSHRCRRAREGPRCTH